MPEPDWPVRPPCWAFTRGQWRKARLRSDRPIPGHRMGPNWDPGHDAWMVHTEDGHIEPVPTHHLVVGEDGVRPEEPGDPPEDWEPDGGPLPFLP